MATRFPLSLAFKRALEWPLENWRSLLPATLLLGLVDAACFAGVLAAVNVDEAGVLQPRAEAGPLLLGALLIASIVGLAYGLGLYRRVLLGEHRPGLSLFVLDRRLLRAIGVGARMCGIGFTLVLASALLSRLVGIPAFLPTLVLFAYLALIVPRFRLAFAAAALDEPNPTLGEAWRRTRGAAVNVVVGVVSIYLVLTVAQWIVALLPLLNEGVPAFLIAGLFAALQSCVSVVFLALAYDALVRGGGPESHVSLH
ncbi:hypothetical protein [Roseiterribacter gracilis]|uniref:Uncharacterized protein n=1 Tax=Roseiterribacter gracilis TaxID=2812848 RepID=A0A8S8XHS2_9PROT|nr:hypothetical protein TMPK1_33340 [Rhodospirillales bacterium TMPK1]